MGRPMPKPVQSHKKNAPALSDQKKNHKIAQAERSPVVWQTAEMKCRVGGVIPSIHKSQIKNKQRLSALGLVRRHVCLPPNVFHEFVVRCLSWDARVVWIALQEITKATRTTMRKSIASHKKISFTPFAQKKANHVVKCG